MGNKCLSDYFLASNPIGEDKSKAVLSECLDEGFLTSNPKGVKPQSMHDPTYFPCKELWPEVTCSPCYMS